MEVKKNYKFYSRLFFGFVLSYQLFLVYVVAFADLPPIIKVKISTSYIFVLFYIALVIVNKSILYYRQKEYYNFGFFENSYYRDEMGKEILGFIKSLIGVFFYFALSYYSFEFLFLNNREFDYTPLLVVLKASLYFFPIILITWDIKRLRFLPLVQKENIEKKRQSQLAYNRRMEVKKYKQSQPKGIGTKTGYEPSKLKEFELMPNSLMRGNPKDILDRLYVHQSKFNFRMDEFKELNFAKLLQKNGYLDKFATYWAPQNLFERTPGRAVESQKEVDCILVSNKNIYLIELKIYDQGNITWRTVEDGKGIQAIDNITGYEIGKTKNTSENILNYTKKIQSQIKELDIHMNVQPYVIMMPSENGLGELDNVFWPGSIACLNPMDFLEVIEEEQPYYSQLTDKKTLDDIFTKLVKPNNDNSSRFNW